MYNKIVVPLDGSNVAETVLPYVREFADSLKAQIELLGVIEPVLAGIHDYVYSKHHISVEDLLLKQTEDYLKKASAYFSGTPGTVTTKIVKGIAAEKIVEEARDPSTLIAMSTHGRSGVGRWAMGSVTDKVLHMAAKPMFIVRGSDEKPAAAAAKFRNVIVPLDGSSVAEQALVTATEIAKSMNLKIIIARVTPPLAGYYQFTEYPAINFGELAQELDKDATKYLETVEQKLKNSGVGQVEKVLLHGNAAAAIIDEAKKVPDSFVIMTTHGLSGVKRTILGSITDRVVTESDRPVLVVTASA